MPPQIHVHKNFQSGIADVMKDIAKTGFWPTTLVSKPSPPPYLHWHRMEAHGYVMEGTTWILDGETGQQLTVEPGDKLVIPPGALHIEGEAETDVTYIVAIPTTQSLIKAFELMPADHPDRPLQ